MWRPETRKREKYSIFLANTKNELLNFHTNMWAWREGFLWHIVAGEAG